MASTLQKQSDYIVYVDESGDHGLTSINPNYPIFVLAFCIFEIDSYISSVVPAIQRFKFRHFGHDMIVLHEREIRKAEREFRFLFDAQRRRGFFTDLNLLIETVDFTVIASVIDKRVLEKKTQMETNPYHIAMEFCLERLHVFLCSRGHEQSGTTVVFEKRGKNEDEALELEFRRICQGRNIRAEQFPFEIVLAPKSVNSSGLQLADLIARPIGLSILRPDQPNRAFDIVKRKFFSSPAGDISGWGLKCEA